MLILTALLMLHGYAAVVDSSCAEGHFEGRRCIRHKTKTDCLNHYNINANGEERIDKICGWSINEDSFGGEAKSNCASAPWVTANGLNAVADFGACNETLGGGAEVAPTPMPTCGECSEFDGDKSGCKKADPARYCVDACVWNKNNSKCTGVFCADLDGRENMYKCTKKLKKQYDVDCWFDVRDDTCSNTNDMVDCSRYNLSMRKNVRKKACKKLGKIYNQCKFSSASKRCYGKDEVVPCNEIISMGACNGSGGRCTYLKEQARCMDM